MAKRQTKMIVMLFFILVIASMVVYYKTVANNMFSILQNNSTNSQELLKDTHQVITLSDENLKMHLVVDMNSNVHFFISDNKEIITSNIIFNIKTKTQYGEEKDIHWTAYELPGKYFILAGIIANNNIQRIEVNELKKEIQYFEYMNYTFFYTTTRMDTPYLIKGFSIEDKLIYSNF